jgi:probable rRNA maturation factor
VVCPEVADRNAEELGHDLETELQALIVHGTLHLLGYDHDTDEDRAKMNERTKEIIDSFNEELPR